MAGPLPATVEDDQSCSTIVDRRGRADWPVHAHRRQLRRRGRARHLFGIADFDEAIHLNPNRASLYRDRALARRQNGDLELAIEDYDEAIAHDPRHAAPYHQRGLALAAAGDLDRAILSYNTAVRLDPSDAQPRLDRGLAFLARGQANEARADFEAALALPAGKDARTRDAARAKLAELASAEPTRLAAPGR